MISHSYKEPKLDRVFCNFFNSTCLAVAHLGSNAPTQARLILPRQHDRNVHHLWTACYRQEQATRTYLQDPLIIDSPAEAVCWVKAHPKVTVLGTNLVLEWLEAAGLRLGHNFQFVSLNVENRSDLTGIRESSWEVGAEAAEMVVGRIHLNRTGVPKSPHITLIEPTWQQGDR
ncbi:MAG: Transcriptional regulator LacI family [Puniceicoccaceae bacterium 5H]|nr:MAG: Transcriptional regulator LacI family [Puniceicoccaceae bacterium 5H]